ncbi:MAG TPA: hypothetical protein VFO73_00975 [Candidatus Limnocylindrales bacterium]|jgi:hypothetical protein|nr:hypothetical protein [Candidatus Limnocylindrales bacterium]
MTSRDAGFIVVVMPDDTETLLRRLKEAVARRDGATRGSPEWDAAMDYVDDIERRLELAHADTEAVPA